MPNFEQVFTLTAPAHITLVMLEVGWPLPSKSPSLSDAVLEFWDGNSTLWRPVARVSCGGPVAASTVHFPIGSSNLQHATRHLVSCVVLLPF